MSSNPYGRNPNGDTVDIIDVASPQGPSLNWALVAADGVYAAWMQDDTTFARNWRESRANGIKRGPYQFFRPEQDPIQQADALLSKIGDFDESDLTPMLDVEAMHGQTAEHVLDGALRWCEHVGSRLGRSVLWYTFPGFCSNPSDFNRPDRQRGLGGLTRPEQLAQPLWISHFKIDPNNGAVYGLTHPIVPKPWMSWRMWQIIGNHGPRIPGIPIDIDRSVYWGSKPDFDAEFAGQKPASQESTVDADDGTAKNPIRAGSGEHRIDLGDDDEDFNA